ncbi:MAG: VOC family protein [Desulforhabdus sp.]|nr:VOC family protein [Desulforhabdus sp.]
MISRIDHVAVAVKDFEGAESFFQSILGAVPGSQGKDRKLNFFWKVFSLGDLSRIELLTPTEESSFLDNFFASRTNGGVHHITMQTPSILKAKELLEESGIPYFGYKEHGDYWKELFIHPRDAFGVLIQIAEFRAHEWLSDSVNMEEGRKWSIEKQGKAFCLQLDHPGGGKVALDLSREELERLVEDIAAVLEQRRLSDNT